MLGACGDDDGGDETGATGGDGTTGATASNGEGGSNGTAAGELTTATLGLLPITDVAPFFLAQQEGWFEELGLDVGHEFAAGGAAILPSVESGEFELGYSNIVSLLLLQSRGASFKILAGGGLTATGDEPDYSEMWVPEDSDVEDLSQLGGHTVAINTLGNILEIATREAVSQAGGDHESIEFAEVPFPDMAAALQSGQVDAILYNEPFQTILQREGGVRSIGRPFVDSAPGEIIAFYFTKADDAEGDVATAFRDGMARANEFAAENPDELREVIPTYSEVSEEIASELVMPPYVADSVRESSVQIYAELMAKYGIVDEVPDYQALLP